MSQPIAGGDRAINRDNLNNASGVRQGNLAGGRVDPGYGVPAASADRWRGAYGAYHRGWVNGYWHGNHTNPSWDWGSFALGAATGVMAWGVGSSIFDWGYASYSNPYYDTSAAPPVDQPVAAVEGQPAAVAYDYSQPIDTQAPPPEATVADQATATFDSARAAFMSGDYTQALQLDRQALATMPNDATLHEFRALCLFALQKYEQAASPLYAVLSVGPGWDWTTLSGLYPNVDVYTQQLRALEAYVQANSKSSGSRFVLAYHYLSQDHPDAALQMLEQVVGLSPNDTLSPQLIQQISGGTKGAPAASPASAPAATPTPTATPTPPAAATMTADQLEGSWSASPTPTTTISLTIQKAATFTWKVVNKGKTQEFSGNWSLTSDVLTLARSEQGGAMVGNVARSTANGFNFRIIGAPPNDPGLSFTR